MRLGERVHVRLAERLAADRQLPAEGEEFLRVEEGGAVGRGPGRGTYDRGGRERTGQLAGPVDGHTGSAEPGRRRTQQLVQLVLRQRQYVGDRAAQEAAERRPHAGRAAQRQHRVDAGAGAEAFAAAAGPQGGGVDDARRVGQAVHLDQGRARPALLAAVPVDGLVRLFAPCVPFSLFVRCSVVRDVEDLELGQVDAQ